MIPVVLACTDLMTSSRLELAAGLAVKLARTEGAVRTALAERPDATLVVDLAAFPDLVERLAADAELPAGGCVAFAPHVHEDLLEAARAHAQVVAPRGATMRALADQVARARSRMDPSPSGADVPESAV